MRSPVDGKSRRSRDTSERKGREVCLYLEVKTESSFLGEVGNEAVGVIPTRESKIAGQGNGTCKFRKQVSKRGNDSNESGDHEFTGKPTKLSISSAMRKQDLTHMVGFIES